MTAKALRNAKNKVDRIMQHMPVENLNRFHRTGYDTNNDNETVRKYALNEDIIGIRPKKSPDWIAGLFGNHAEEEGILLAMPTRLRNNGPRIARSLKNKLVDKQGVFVTVEPPQGYNLTYVVDVRERE